MKKFIILGVVIHLSIVFYAQNVEKKIDQIFEEWNQKDHPGGVVSIVKKDEVLFSKAYGQANIKYNVPNKVETIFNIGSVSKQFTAMGIVILSIEGKLSVDDDIRKYLPELYDFKHEITIRHLLHHTSGFRSTPELFGLAGWRDGDAITTEDDYRYLCKQTNLNFEPGEQFMYTNSGYILLAKIIENVTGENYNKWMHNHIFIPLGMKNTFVDEANNNANPQIATPYNEFEEQQFSKGENTSLDIGASNIYTTAEDLTKWMSNFRVPIKGWEDAFNKLQTIDKLNNGEINNYAFGVFMDDFFGNKRIYHTGGVPGFLSFAEYYPDDELTIVLLTNFTSYDVNNKYMMLSQLFLKNKTSKSENLATIKEVPFDAELAKKYTGDYWNVKENYPRKIYLEKDTLWYLRANGMKSPLVQIGANQFIIGGIKAFVSVQFEIGEKKKMMVSEKDKKQQYFEEYDSSPLTISEMEKYTGTFYSSELETTYTISLVDNQLIGYHSRHGEFPVKVLKRNVVDWAGMAIAKYKYNNKKEIEGFYVSLNRVENVWFEKR
ncbi:MAG: beta-lactamase family protein [Flavobacteriales bacterium]|nr:beta-lactamase family protein [Flavobacteriales bacterium]